MAETQWLTFHVHKFWDDTRKVLTVTLCGDSGKVFCTVEASPLTGIVSVSRAGADGSFIPIGEFLAGVTPKARFPVALTPEQVRADYEGQTLCPHCGNTEGNAGRLRCFICNREI